MIYSNSLSNIVKDTRTVSTSLHGADRVPQRWTVVRNVNRCPRFSGAASMAYRQTDAKITAAYERDADFLAFCHQRRIADRRSSPMAIWSRESSTNA
jgi:hypothetical protein